MAILTSDYKHVQNGQPQDYNTTKEYREDFKNQDIDSAQALITSNNDYLVMDASKLNDLCDTINYMQQIWDDDKAEFQNWYLGMTHYEQYDPTYTYKVGSIVQYNNDNYFCIVDNTTGTWDGTKWARIGNDDVGLDFIGDVLEGTVPPPQRSKLYIETPFFWTSSLPWKCGTEVVGYTHPNIRYLTESMTPYTSEIYMCDWNGGEG